MPVGGACSYCGGRAAHADHVVPKSVYKRLRPILKLPDWFYETVPACMTCNTAKMARLLVPESWASRLPLLNALGIGRFRTWDGSMKALREVCK